MSKWLKKQARVNGQGNHDNVISVQCSECQSSSKQTRVNGKTLSVSVWCGLWWCLWCVCLWCTSLWLWLLLWCVSSWLWLWLSSWYVCVCGVVWHVENAPGLYIQNVPVCRHHAHVCFNTCARGAGIHGDVLNVHTGTFLDGHTGFFSVSHTHQTQHQRNVTRRRTEREREKRQRKRREKRRREEGGRRKREEKEEKNSVLTCTRVACTCRRHSFCSFPMKKRT